MIGRVTTPPLVAQLLIRRVIHVGYDSNFTMRRITQDVRTYDRMRERRQDRMSYANRNPNTFGDHHRYWQTGHWRQERLIGFFGIGIGIVIIINLWLHFPPISLLQSFLWWKEGLHDQVPVTATASLQTPLCNLLSYGRAFGSVAKRYNLSLSTRSKLTK